jgi:hypothetical protein
VQLGAKVLQQLQKHLLTYRAAIDELAERVSKGVMTFDDIIREEARRAKLLTPQLPEPVRELLDHREHIMLLCHGVLCVSAAQLQLLQVQVFTEVSPSVNNGHAGDAHSL